MEKDGLEDGKTRFLDLKIATGVVLVPSPEVDDRDPEQAKQKKFEIIFLNKVYHINIFPQWKKLKGNQKHKSEIVNFEEQIKNGKKSVVCFFFLTKLADFFFIEKNI